MQPQFNVSMVKAQNRLTVFNQLVKAGEITRMDLARRCGVSVGTVVTILDELARAGAVVEQKDSRASIGRRPHVVKPIGSGRHLLAIDLASRTVRYECLDLELRTAGWGQYRFDETLTAEENLDRMLGEAKEFLSAIGVVERRLIGVSVSVPGSYRESSDTIEQAAFPELHAVNPRALVAGHFKSPVYIDHDVFLSARAELPYIADYQAKNVFYLFLGEGIGGALATHGRLYRGARDDAGDIGHIRLNGQRTLEELVSWNRLVEFAVESAPESAADVREYLATEFSQPASGVRECVLESCEYIALGIQNLFWIVDPDAIVLAGEYQLFGEELRAAIVRKLAHYLDERLLESLDIRLSRHGSRGALVGAGELARERWLTGDSWQHPAPQ